MIEVLPLGAILAAVAAALALGQFDDEDLV